MPLTYATPLPLVAILLLLTQGCASHTPVPAPAMDVPANLQVNGPTVTRVHAEGFQVYTLKPHTSGNLAWVLKAPDAAFENAAGIRGKHYAGPTWECTTDGSKVVGRKVAEHPSPKADAVPWLLLEATRHDGSGVFSTVTFIQRVNTVGGKAPAVDDAKSGDEVRVPYEADYVFYGAGATTKTSLP